MHQSPINPSDVQNWKVVPALPLVQALLRVHALILNGSEFHLKTAVRLKIILEEVYLRQRAAVRPAPFRPILHTTEDGGRKEERESARLRGRIEERSYPIPSRLIDKPPRTRPDSDGQ